MEKRFGYITENESRTCELTNSNGLHSNMLMDITVHHMKKDEKKIIQFNKKEFIVLLVTGKIELHYENKVEVAKRASFVEEEPYCLHVCKDTVVKIVAMEDSEILIQATENETAFPSKFYEPEDCRLMISGEHLYDNRAKRLVRTVIDYEIAPYSNLVIGEVVSESGGWSSYLPHHHPQPEVYYYRYERPEGFGACFIGEEAYKVTDKSYAAIEGGLTHPQVSAPGYPMYYVWMIRHLEGNPWTTRIDDERYTWLLQK